MAVAKKAAVRNTKAGQRKSSIQKLLNAARHLFVSKGYASTTLEEIAAAVEMTKGSVYFYFRSKETVLLALLDEAETIVIDPVLLAIEAKKDDATAKLVTFLHHQAELGVSQRENMLLIILMSLEFDDGPVSEKVKSLYSKLYKRLEAIVREGQGTGEFRKDAPARELASIIVANHDGTFLEWYRRGTELSGSKLVRALRGIVVRGISV